VPDLGAADLVLLAGAAFAAGAVNAVAGGGSLLSFPALLAVGYSGVTANVTNMVALVPGYAAGTTAYRRELAGQGHRARTLGATSAAGAAAGTAILLLAPGGAFDAIVPALILLACGLLAAQPVIARTVARREIGHHGLHMCVFAGAIYGGYFGAGLGIMLLAVLAAFLDEDLQRLNALKGLLSLVVAVVSAVSVGLFGPVAWGPALLMAAASVGGGFLGVGIARRLPATVLRWGIVVFGVVVAVILAVRQIA
jgi:uncharacterized protein